MIKDRIDLFKEIISNQKSLSFCTKGSFICKTLNDKSFKHMKKFKLFEQKKEFSEFFNSKQEVFEFFVLIFLYKFHPGIKKKINNSLKENELFFYKYNDESSPDVKIKKYWYEISSISSNIFEYKNIEKFLDKTYKKINKNTKFIHHKKDKNFVDFLEQTNYFIKEINQRISNKLNKIYKDKKNGKKFKIKRLVIFQAYPISIGSSIFFLEYWIKKQGKEIYKKIEKNIKIYICFPESFNKEIIVVESNFSEKEPRSSTKYKNDQNIVIEINSKNKVIYENNKKIYETHFFKTNIGSLNNFV